VPEFPESRGSEFPELTSVWRKLVAPWAEYVAQALLDSFQNQASPRFNSANTSDSAT
jgi:hypothetical protein